MGHVYFVRGGSMVKIGFAEDVAKRLSQLQTGSPVPLHILAVLPDCTMAVERVYHDVFDDLRSHGEWFRYTHLMGLLVDAVRAGLHPRTPEHVADVVDMLKDQLKAGERHTRPIKISAATKAPRFQTRAPVSAAEKATVLAKADTLIAHTGVGEEGKRWGHIHRRYALRGLILEPPAPELDSFLTFG